MQGPKLISDRPVDVARDVAAHERAALVASLKLVAAGDRAALNEVYRRTSAKLFGVALRILPESHEAEDVLQDVYLTIWQKAGTFDPARASPITWLVTLTRNRAIDRLRSRGGRMTTMIDLVEDIVDCRPGVEHRMIAHQTDAHVLICIETLAKDEAALIRTAFFDGATYAEIATRVGAPLGTIKSRMRRALMKLKACLG